jgi:hypothetical protein
MGKTLLEVVDCKGNPMEAGRQYGEACRESVHSAVELLAIIQNHGPIPVGRDQTQGMPSHTNASIVMLPREGRMIVAAGPPCENDNQPLDV